MRAAPPLQVTVVRFGVWRTALGAVIAVGTASVAAWLLTAADRPSAVLLGGGALSLAALAGAASALRVSAYRLRWDGERWHVGAAAAAAPGAIGDEPWSGRVDVAVDLGDWLLLRFSAASGPPRCPHRWLPAQRRGLEAQWHVLRATVYCARLAAPDPGNALAAAGRDPAA